MIGASLQPKALGLSVVFAIGLGVLYPDVTNATFLTIFYIPLYLLSSFRD